MNPAPPPPASDLTTRFAAAVAMIAVAVAAIWFGGWPFRLLVAAAAAVMLLEWCEMHGLQRRWAYGAVALLLGATLILPELLFPASGEDPTEIGPALLPLAGLGFGAIVLLGILLGLAGRKSSLGWGFVYIAVPAFALVVLRWLWFELVFWLMLVTWATDIFAYFAGRSIGGPKLARRISPKKTWSGLAGGVAGAAVVGAIAAYVFGIGAPFLYFGAVMGLIAQLGDLYESSVKRRLGVKDSGSILPGHGGVLDRADGLLAVSLATFALLALTLATA
jgi:phosphatidate cytidylyltransferase